MHATRWLTNTYAFVFRFVINMLPYLFRNALDELDSPTMPGHFTWAITFYHSHGCKSVQVSASLIIMLMILI